MLGRIFRWQGSFCLNMPPYKMEKRGEGQETAVFGANIKKISLVWGVQSNLSVG